MEKEVEILISNGNSPIVPQKTWDTFGDLSVK